MKYHRDLGFPKTIIIPEYKLILIYSTHAIEKYKSGLLYPIIRDLKIELEDIIEIKTKDNIKCTTMLVRKRLDNYRDIVLAIKPFNMYAVVMTVWINNKGDQHETLDKSKYDLPDNNNSKEIDEIYAGITNKPLN